VLMTPTPFQDSPFLSDPAEANRRLELFIGVTKKIAEKRKLDFADLYTRVTRASLGFSEFRSITDNGMHLTEEGYVLARGPFGNALGVQNILASAGVGVTAQLRQAIIEKNKLYFYRWRPQNETYLFGFRKQEQGKNAKEIAEFDPLIAKAEQEIDRLKKVMTPKEKISPVEKK
jgi:hypothetical protein